MKIRPVFYGKIENGKLQLEHPDQFKQFAASMKGEIQLTLENKKRSRSLNQNNYYWGVIIPILCDYLGYNPEEMHEAIKWQFLRIDHEKVPSVKSSTDLSTVEWEDLMSRIRQWASIEFALYIPEPNEAPYEITT